MKDHHFFGSTAFNWAVGQTREEVLEKLGRMAGAEVIKRNVKASGGLYAWTVKVECPQDTRYDIHNFQPVGQSLVNSQEFNIMAKSGASLPITKEHW